jgi:methionine-rich copper-binding protein CopC
MSTTPAANATGVASTANVTATFSEEMKASSIISPATTFKLVKLNADGTTTKVTANVSYDAATKTATLDPASNLSSGTYKATVTTGAQDLAGNALDQNPNIAGNQSKSWKFTVVQ